MMERGGGSIINISSCAAKLMISFHSSYAMAKGGLENLTRQMALELAPRLNAIAPAPTSSERNRGYDPDYG
jgi:NAD(P)-dependent dehydrogenase (short-subunit alcohol dehydrogenase family)